jgi:glycerol-3-phosphate O-acyltransferase
MTAGASTTGGEGRADDAKPGHDARSAEERAEEIVERVSAEVARVARRLLGRAREEVEDIVAEAQNLRRGQRTPE